MKSSSIQKFVQTCAILVVAIFSAHAAKADEIQLIRATENSIDLTGKLHPIATARPKLILDVLGDTADAKDKIELNASRDVGDTKWYLITLKNDSKDARRFVLVSKDPQVLSISASTGLGKIGDKSSTPVPFAVKANGTITLALESPADPKNILLLDQTTYDGQQASSFAFLAVGIGALLASLIFGMIMFQRRSKLVLEFDESLVEFDPENRRLPRRTFRPVVARTFEEPEPQLRELRSKEENEAVADTDTAKPQISSEANDPWSKLRDEFKLAYERRQLEIIYQPIFKLADRSIEAIDASLQWNHPVYGPIAWSHIAALMAGDELLEHLDHYIVDTSVAQLGSWQQQNPLRQPVSLVVNVGGLKTDASNFVGHLSKAAAQHNLPRSSIHIQVQCAGIGYHRETINEFMSRIKSHGFGIAGGNFGWGGADINLLKSFSFGRISIDPSLFQASDDADRSSVFTRSTIAYFKAIGSRVTVAGIADDWALRQFLQAGCELGQGHPFAAAIAPEALNNFLSTKIRNRTERPFLSLSQNSSPFRVPSLADFIIGTAKTPNPFEHLFSDSKSNRKPATPSLANGRTSSVSLNGIRQFKPTPFDVLPNAQTNLSTSSELNAIPKKKKKRKAKRKKAIAAEAVSSQVTPVAQPPQNTAQQFQRPFLIEKKN